MSNSDQAYENFIVEFKNAVLKCGRSDSDIQLIAVSKTQPLEKVKSVYLKGQHHFGENYAQEALDKQKQLLDSEIIWHFIGSLQKNKVKHVVGNFELIHSVDDLSLAKKISDVSSFKACEQKCLLQINIGEEESKGGISISNINSLIDELFALPNIIWQGIMSMPPITSDEKQAREYLKSTKSVFDMVKTKLNDKQKKQWVHLSMGTSHDFVWAIEEGATMVRIGSLIFGARNRI